MRNLRKILSLLEDIGVGADGVGAAGSVSPYQELTKKGMKYKQPVPTQFSWVAYSGEKEIDKGYMDAVDLNTAKIAARRSGLAIKADTIKVLGRDGKVLSTISLKKEYMDGIIDRKIDEAVGFIGSGIVGRPLQPVDVIYGNYALVGLTDDGTVDVVLSKSEEVISREHYKFRIAGYKRIGRTKKLPKKFNGKTLDYNSFVDYIKSQFEPKRIGSMTLK